LRRREIISAFEAFKKADKQDGGHCRACQRLVIKYGEQLQEWKAVETAAEEIVAAAQGPKEVALAHYQLGIVLINEGSDRHKGEVWQRAHEEMVKALDAAPKFPNAVFDD